MVNSKKSIYGIVNEVPEPMTVIVGRDARDIFAEECRLEDVLQVLPRLEHG